MTWADKLTAIKPGDVICYRTSHLMASGLMRSELPHMSGKVLAIDGGKAQVEWYHGRGTASVLVEQIIRIPERGVIA